MKQILSIIEPLRKEYDAIDNKNGPLLIEINETINSFSELVNEYARCWIGGWGQNDFNHYRNPNDESQGIKIEPDNLYALIKKEFKIDTDRIPEKIQNCLNPYQKFQCHLLTELSIIKDTEGFKSENEILQSIEKFKWGLEASDYIKLVRPNQIMVYDPGIINKGLPTPPHIAVTGYFLSLSTKAFSAKNFGELVIRLLRQLEIKISAGTSQSVDNYSSIFLQSIFDNFHIFYNQLKNRHDHRETITIQDEYDVQDILHALLKLNFKDVREEEYTPSYAGSSTRMDFLLKNENTVIEVKKTRDRLSGKEIGEQLILDISHYRNHPNCKSLICFVYDPENRIKNPRGLESDINRATDEAMSVELYIRP
jgi:REase_DpnII-MboI